MIRCCCIRGAPMAGLQKEIIRNLSLGVLAWVTSCDICSSESYKRTELPCKSHKHFDSKKTELDFLFSNTVQFFYLFFIFFIANFRVAINSYFLLSIKLLICSCSQLFSLKMFNKIKFNSPESKITSSNWFFCPTSSPKHKNSTFILRNDKETQQILTFKLLEPANVERFCSARSEQKIAT